MSTQGAQDGSAHITRHPVRAVTRRTGLSAYVLRAWERRYGVVAPVRTEGGQRLYTDADIERLAFLKALTDSGYSIGQLAHLPQDELRRLYHEEPARSVPPATGDGVEEARRAVLKAIEDFDATVLRRELEGAAVTLGVPRFLEEVLTPVLTDIGLRWERNNLSIAHEHLASAQIRQVLGWIRQAAETSGPAPVLVVATPAGQVHEGGALIVAAAAATQGWRVTYLGTNLPALQIAEAARRTGAVAVALSLLFPEDDPALPGELGALTEALPPRTALIVGGAAAPAYAPAIEAANGEVIRDLPGLRATLRALATGRRGAPAPKHQRGVV